METPRGGTMKKLIFLIAFLLVSCSESPQMLEKGASMPNPDAMPVPAEDYAQAKMTRAESKSSYLGTKWGDEVQSSVRSVDLKRKSSSPIDENALYYSAAKTVKAKNLNSISLAAGRVSLEVKADRGNFPLYRANGRYYLQGRDGEAYSLRYKNHSSQTFEIIASVDGLNVLNGKAASRYDSGYVLRPNSTLHIEGFRKSDSAVASFIFTSKKADTYAAHNQYGDTKNTGVIGTVIYELENPKPTPMPKPPCCSRSGQNPFPADNGYAPEPF